MALSSLTRFPALNWVTHFYRLPPAARFPRFRSVTRFPALSPSYVFSRALFLRLHRLHVFPRLLPVTRFISRACQLTLFTCYCSEFRLVYCTIGRYSVRLCDKFGVSFITVIRKLLVELKNKLSNSIFSYRQSVSYKKRTFRCLEPV